MSQRNLQKWPKLFMISIIVTLILLLIQYVLGAITEMYVQIPDSLPNGDAWMWIMKNSSVAQVHIMVGTLLLLTSLFTIIAAIVIRKTSLIVISIIGFVMIVVAWQGGSDFLSPGQKEMDSLMMRLGFIAAIGAYIWSTFLAQRLRN